METVITITTSRDMLVISGTGVYAGPTYDVLEGWYGLDADSRFVKRPNAAGSFAPTRTYPNARLVSIEGQFFAGSFAEAVAMRQRIAALYDDGLPVTISVTDAERTTSREVHVEAVEIPWTARPEIRFTIDARAADPRRYGAPSSDSTGLAVAGGGLSTPLAFPLTFGIAATDGRLTTSNGGNTLTASRFTVDGGSMPDGFVLVNVSTGQRLTYLGPLLDGTSIVLDGRIRTALINGTAPANRYLSNPEWWEVAPGQSVDVQLLALGPTTGTPTLTAETASAYY